MEKTFNGALPLQRRKMKVRLRCMAKVNRVGYYFARTFMDNFEWSEGYEVRFGLVQLDFKTQLRRTKNAGYWWRDYLNNR